MPEPTTRRGKDTKGRIVELAAALMYERGVSATSIEDILAASGTGKSQFYHYFSSKEELIAEVLRHQLQQVLQEQSPREITATTEQLGRLDEALPRIAASADAPFAMTIGGRTYRERGPASSAVVDTVRQAYSEGKRWGAQKAFPVASLRGVEVLASRLLTSDEVVLSVNVPCRTRAVAAKDFTGREANGVGLVRRIENMVAEIPAYRAEVEHRQDFARTRTEELLAVADVPFEHEVALRDKEHELHTLTAQLHLDANSPQAHARAEAARERLAAQGRTPGWSLALNPTPALLKERGEGSAGLATTREWVTADVVAPNGVADAQASPDRARDAVRLAGLSHPRSVGEQLADRRHGSDSGGHRAPESTPYRGIEEERGR